MNVQIVFSTVASVALALGLVALAGGGVAAVALVLLIAGIGVAIWKRLRCPKDKWLWIATGFVAALLLTAVACRLLELFKMVWLKDAKERIRVHDKLWKQATRKFFLYLAYGFTSS